MIYFPLFPLTRTNYSCYTWGMNIKTLDEKAEAMLKRLEAKRDKAVWAHDTFRKSFENAQDQKAVWDRMCEMTGIVKESNMGDWMC